MLSWRRRPYIDDYHVNEGGTYMDVERECVNGILTDGTVTVERMVQLA